MHRVFVSSLYTTPNVNLMDTSNYYPLNFRSHSIPSRSIDVKQPSRCQIKLRKRPRKRKKGMTSAPDSPPTGPMLRMRIGRLLSKISKSPARSVARTMLLSRKSAFPQYACRFLQRKPSHVSIKASTVLPVSHPVLPPRACILTLSPLRIATITSQRTTLK